MSRCLAERSIDHVLLERGEVANSWRTERWDSLRLLTPNWQSRLPGFRYDGDDPDGYRTLPEVDRIHRKLCPDDLGAGEDPHEGHLCSRADGTGIWCAPTAATGAAGPSSWLRAPATSPRVPDFAIRVPSSVTQLTAQSYRNPGPARRRRRPGRGGIVERHPDRPGAPSFGAARLPCRSASTSGRRAFIAARTWNGGWTPPACSTSATTRSTTSRGRGEFPRCSLPARPTAPPSTSTR